MQLMKRNIYTPLILILYLAAVLLTGCRQAAVTKTGTDASGSAASAQTSLENTSIQTSASTASATTQATAAATTPASTAAAPNLAYRALPADQVHKVDLNNDQVQESIKYTCADDYKGSLTLNGTALPISGDMLLTGWFFLVDLDTRDACLDVAVQELGASDDYLVTFYYYNGSRLIKRGSVPGMIGDPYSSTIAKDPFGLGTIQLDGLGNLVASARGNILHTWFYDQTWTIGTDKLLVKVAQAFYPMKSIDQATGKQLAETAVKLKMDLPLVDQPGSTKAAATVKSGQDASLVQCDNREWVQLRTGNGSLGWFHVVDNYQVLVNGVKYFSEDVFDGLTFAD